MDVRRRRFESFDIMGHIPGVPKESLDNGKHISTGSWETIMEVC